MARLSKTINRVYRHFARVVRGSPVHASRGDTGSHRQDRKHNLVMFWKQNDSTIYGRRQDMLLKYLAMDERIGKIVHFDYPVSRKILESFQSDAKTDSTSERGLVYEQTVSRLQGRMDSDNVACYTFFYEQDFDIAEYIAYIEDALARNGIDPRSSVFFSFPRDYHFPKIAKHFKPEIIVADVIDDHRAWPQTMTNRLRLTKNYKDILRMADLTLANCESVYSSMSSYSRNIHLIENACELFGREQLDWDLPEELKGYPSPIIGYVGNLLDSRLDFALLEKMFGAFPGYSFLFIGSTHSGNRLKEISQNFDNVHLLGVKAYPDAIKYINAFDIAIIPHIANEFTLELNPLKAYVYAGLGVPIVSTRIANIESLSQFIEIADTHDDFQRLVEKIVSAKSSKPDPETLKKELYDHSWEERVNRVLLELASV